MNNLFWGSKSVLDRGLFRSMTRKCHLSAQKLLYRNGGLIYQGR